MSHKRHLLVILLLIILCIISSAYTPAKIDHKKKFTELSVKINGWEFIEDIKIGEGVLKILEPHSLFFRRYRNERGQNLTLTFVYHQNDRWGAHDPIVCYTSQGWKIIEKNNVVKLKVEDHEISINRFKVKKYNIINLVYYYWFSSNKKITASKDKQLFHMFLNGIVHGFTECGFVEISIPLNFLNEKETILAINDFTNKFTQILKKSF